MDNHSHLLERRRLLNFAITSAALGAHFVSLLIATMSRDEGKAIWNDRETLGLVDYFLENKSKMPDGGTFTEVEFNGAAERIAEYWTAGPVKNAKHCRTKWLTVSHPTNSESESQTDIVPSAQIYFSRNCDI